MLVSKQQLRVLAQLHWLTWFVSLEHATELPPLNEQQTTKLKHLSIVSMSEESRVRGNQKVRFSTLSDLNVVIYFCCAE